MNRIEGLYGFEYRNRRSLGNRRPHHGGRSRGGFELGRLWQRSHEILRMKVMGHKDKDIAAALGITPVTVANCTNSELGMKKLAEMRLQRDCESIDVAKEITAMLPDALRVYQEILHKESVAPLSLKKQTAKEVIMDMGGYRAPTRIEGRVAHAHLTMEDIEELKQRGRVAAVSMGLLDDDKGE